MQYINKKFLSIAVREVVLKGRVVIITGASAGMGKATVFYLSNLGVNTVLAARRLDLIKEYEKTLKNKFGTDPLSIQVDVTNDYDVEHLVDVAAKKYGRIDFAVSFAGNPVGYATRDRRKPIHEQDINQLKEIAEVDHFGSVRVLKYVLPYMIKQRFGRIILISSTASVYGYSEDVDYIPYKRANEGLVISSALRSIREKWGVEFYVIAPGDVFNPSTWDSYDNREKMEVLKYGIIESETVAKIVSLLLSGKLKKKYVMKVDLDKGKVLDKGSYYQIKNGDIIVIDAKTVPKLLKSVGGKYKTFVPDGF